MLPIANQIETYLDRIPSLQKYSRAGSLRRMPETIKDIDFIIATDEPAIVRELLLGMEQIKQIIAKGDTKISVIIEAEYDVNIDFRLVTATEYATTLHHFTGSKEHNVALRQLAKQRGEKISEYGVEVVATNELLTFETENDFFNHFQLHSIPPEVRENQGELIAYEHEVSLVEQSQIRGDLHMHTTWSDGGQSIEEMVNHARSLGYEYISITDHSKYLRIANGLTEDRLRRQRDGRERGNANILR